MQLQRSNLLIACLVDPPLRFQQKYATKLAERIQQDLNHTSF